MNMPAGVLPHWSTAKHFRRDQRAVLVTTASTLLCAANPNRMGLVVSCPAVQYGGNSIPSTYFRNIDTSTTGIKASYNVAAGQQAVASYASQLETTGTGVISNLQIVQAGNTTNLTTFTTSGQWTGPLPIPGGVTFQINVLTPIAASICDFVLGVTLLGLTNRITLSVNGPAVNDNGIVLPNNNVPLVLWRDVVGDMLTEDIYAIAAIATTTVGLWDIFH